MVKNIPAFPNNMDGENYDGMTLRDYFAIHAPQPTTDQIKDIMEQERLANPHNEPYHNKVQRRGKLEIECSLRYKYADAMLQERNNENS